MNSTIVLTNCPRCGIQVSTMARCLSGTENVFSKYRGICSKCITPDENKEILHEQAMAILRGTR